jgi:RHS repeat-associated protein
MKMKFFVSLTAVFLTFSAISNTWASRDPLGGGDWITRDPIGITDEPSLNLNLYKYVNNNPINLIDPLGLQAMDSVTNSIVDAIASGNSEFLENLINSGVLKPEQEALAKQGIESIAKKAADALAKSCKKLTDGEIKKLQDQGIDPHDLKPNSKYDLFKDPKGDVYVLPKNGQGVPDPTGINIK